jgi:hypothetical protein
MFKSLLRRNALPLRLVDRPRPGRPARRPNPVRLLLERMEDRTVPAAIVLTDQQDYAPGSTALITATSDGGPDHNFAVGETIQFRVTRTDGYPDFPPGNDP